MRRLPKTSTTQSAKKKGPTKGRSKLYIHDVCLRTQENVVTKLSTGLSTQVLTQLEILTMNHIISNYLKVNFFKN